MAFPIKLVNKIKRNRTLKKKPTRLSDQLAVGRFTGSVQGYSWTSYASNFSECLPLCFVAPGTGYSQRGNSDTVDFKGAEVLVNFKTDDTYIARYRVLGITITSNWAVLDSSGIFYMPTTNVMSANFTSTNLWSVPTLITRDQNVINFYVWLDTQFTIDCQNGHNSREELKIFKVPPVRTHYTYADTNGSKTSKGCQYLLFVTDATITSVHYTHDIDMTRSFTCLK